MTAAALAIAVPWTELGLGMPLGWVPFTGSSVACETAEVSAGGRSLGFVGSADGASLGPATSLVDPGK